MFVLFDDRPTRCYAAPTYTTIQVASAVEFDPFAMVDDQGQALGFSIDLIQAVANTVNLHLAITTGTYDIVWHGLLNGQVDVLPVVAKSQNQLVEFGIPYLETFDAFFVRNGSPTIESISAAQSKTIVVVRSDVAHQALLESKFSGKIVLAATIPEGLKMVASGQYDALLTAKLTGCMHIQKYHILGLMPGPIISDYKRIFVFGIKKGSHELREKLNQGLLMIKSSGEYDRIYEKWMALHETSFHFKNTLLIVGCISVGIMLLAFLFLWKKGILSIAKNPALEREIHKRKKTEAILEQSELRLSTISNNLVMGMIYQVVRRSDGTRKFTYLSEQVKNFYGITPEAGIANSGLIYGRVHEEDRIRVYQEEEQAYQAMAVFKTEVRIITPTGGIRWSYFVSSPRKMQNGDVCWDGIEFDITERKKTEEALTQSIKEYRFLFENMHSAFAYQQVILDASGNPIDYIFLEINTAFQKCMGLTRDILGKRVTEIYPGIAQHDPDLIKIFGKVALTGESSTFDIYFQPNCHWYTISAYSPKKGFAITIFDDITERKQAEEALRLTQFAMDNASDAAFWIAQDGHFAYVNKKACSSLGYTREELLKMYVWDVDPDFPREVWVHYWPQFCSTPNLIMEAHHKAKDGHVFSVEIKANYIEFAGRAFSCAFARDITERKQIEITLRQFKAVFDIANFAVAFADMQGRLTYVNEYGASIHGYTVAEVLGKHISIFHNQEQLKDAEQLFLMIQKEGSFLAKELWHCHKNGKPFPMLMTGMVIKDENKNPIYSVATGIDLTERKALEEQIRQAQKMESIGRLAGGVAHDFNNMLGVILGHAEMLMSQMQPLEVLYADLMEIRKAAERSAELTHQLLAFARKQTAIPKILDLNEVVVGLSHRLQRLIGENINLICIPGHNLWRIKIDPSQLDQILSNLCMNAYDAISGTGKIIIEMANVNFDTYYEVYDGSLLGKYVMLSVSDNGCGMNKEAMSHLFEPFFTTKKLGEGAGLGLATIYGIVRQNNGFIKVYSEVGQGTSFKIYLPKYAEEEELENAEPQQKTISHKIIEHGQKTVLLVEDEPSVLQLTKRMLERNGYYVLAASTPGEAMKLARDHVGEICLLLTDVVMPEMNGLELSKQVLALYPNIKLLFMSGYTADIMTHQGVVEDGLHFIQKPFTTKKLESQIRTVLES